MGKCNLCHVSRTNGEINYDMKGRIVLIQWIVEDVPIHVHLGIQPI